MTRADFLLNEWDDFADPKKKAAKQQIIAPSAGKLKSLKSRVPKRISSTSHFDPDAVKAWKNISDYLIDKFGAFISDTSSQYDMSVAYMISNTNIPAVQIVKSIQDYYRALGFYEIPHSRFAKDGSPLTLHKPFILSTKSRRIEVRIQYLAH